LSGIGSPPSLGGIPAPAFDLSRARELLLMWWNATDGADVMRIERRCGGRLVAALLGSALVVLVAAPAPAGAAPIDDARAKVTEAQRAADSATVRYEEAIGRLEELGAQIDDLRVRIEAGRAEAARLRVVARRRAVEAYVGHDGREGAGAFVFDGSDPLDEIRREKLLARTKEREDAAVENLVAVERDLADQRTQLEARRAEQERAVAQVEAEQTAVQAQLRDAQVALDALEEQLRREYEAARAREIAAAVAREASNRSNGKNYSGSYVATGLVCPVRGALSFIDSWGFSRHQGPHQGVDLMAATGTPNVAVVSGNVDFKEGGTSGLGAYLHGDDGNLYYYFHLSAYEGGARHVAQGEVIGYVGNTGDARSTASHTHFEVHPGGGGAVNPYPSVAAVC
jgi:murein DD-endopeptidase MepM/ murein hydrolase activator NlpD